MLIDRLVLAITPLLICGSCDVLKHRTTMKEGCYYYNDKPIFKIVKDQGFLKIPGEIKVFQVAAYGDDRAAEVTFSPSFILNNDPSNSALINMKYDNGWSRNQQQDVKYISTNPGIRINWAAYGESILHLGKFC